MHQLDKVPLWALALAALFFALAPWPLGDEPHLLEKVRMLRYGGLTDPVDIFDLGLHAVFPILLIAKLWRMFRQRRAGAGTPP